MEYFEVVLAGYDGTDNTDHLVKWVAAPNRQVLDKLLTCFGLIGLVMSIDVMDHQGELTFKDGLNVLTDGLQCVGDLPNWASQANLTT